MYLVFAGDNSEYTFGADSLLWQAESLYQAIESLAKHYQEDKFSHWQIVEVGKAGTRTVYDREDGFPGKNPRETKEERALVNDILDRIGKTEVSIMFNEENIDNVKDFFRNYLRPGETYEACFKRILLHTPKR